MKIKKVRGHKRIWKAVEKWKNAHLILDIETMLAFENKQRKHAKITVKPFYVRANFMRQSGNVFIETHQNPQPKKETKKRFINALLDIYESWKNQLEKTQQPYYLKVWIFEPNFSQSQVVCAVGTSINFYNNHFKEPNAKKTYKPNHTDVLKKRIQSFNWQYKINQQFIANTGISEFEDFESKEDYKKAKKWFTSKLKKPHIIENLEKPINNITAFYVFKLDDVWIGERK